DEVLANMSEGENAQTRYVMVDWKMATANSQFGGKFFAPPAFLDDASLSDYSRDIYGFDEQQGLSRFTGSIHTQAYYETMVNRLYRYHGSAMEPQPIVTEWDTESVETRSGERTDINIVPRGENASIVRYFGQDRGGLEAAREYVNETDNAQIGGIGPYPSERVPALEHYRLVQASDSSANPFNAMHPGLVRLLQANQLPVSEDAQRILQSALQERNPQWTKVFERVPGGTIEGEGPANTTVQANVEMKMPNTDRTFNYTQMAETNADGEFDMTVPYSSTGADEWGTEDGYTNTSVRAEGPYEVSTAPTQQRTNETVQTTLYNGSVHVTEGQVIGENESASAVELTESTSEQELNTSIENEETSGNGSLDDGSVEDSQSIDQSEELLDPSILGKARITG
ncbi:MAG: oligosaccharyl transferase, archaeosortase A system-associated, partial [Halovenus sp.]